MKSFQKVMRTVSYCKDTSSLAGTEDYYQKSQDIFRKTLMNQSRQAFIPEIIEMKCHQKGNHSKQSPKKCEKSYWGLGAIPLRGRPSFSWWKAARYWVGKKIIWNNIFPSMLPVPKLWSDGLDGSKSSFFFTGLTFLIAWMGVSPDFFTRLGFFLREKVKRFLCQKGTNFHAVKLSCFLHLVFIWDYATNLILMRWAH